MTRHGFSADFLHEGVREVERVGRQIDRLDRRIELAQRQATKDRLSAERERWAEYERHLRRDVLK